MLKCTLSWFQVSVLAMWLSRSDLNFYYAFRAFLVVIGHRWRFFIFCRHPDYSFRRWSSMTHHYPNCLLWLSVNHPCFNVPSSKLLMDASSTICWVCNYLNHSNNAKRITLLCKAMLNSELTSGSVPYKFYDLDFNWNRDSLLLLLSGLKLLLLWLFFILIS